MANILLVDDNVGLLKMQSEFLRGAGHKVTTAPDGKDGLRLTQDQVFDLVVTDLVMPEKQGIETIIELRRKIPTMKIIAMCGGGRVDATDDLILAQNLGAPKTLPKPFSGKELVEAVASVLSA